MKKNNKSTASYIYFSCSISQEVSEQRTEREGEGTQKEEEERREGRR